MTSRPRSFSQLPREEREAAFDRIVLVAGDEAGWDPKRRQFTIYSETYGGSFPHRVLLKSPKTGAVAIFVRDEEAALANEFWDGELCEYINREIGAKVVVRHAY